MRRRSGIFFLLMIVMTICILGTTGNLFWVTSTQGTPTNLFGGNSSGANPTPNVDPLVFPQEYVIYCEETLSIGGSAKVLGDVALKNVTSSSAHGVISYPSLAIGSGAISGNLDVEKLNGAPFTSESFSIFKSTNEGFLVPGSGSIRQRPFIPPTCCTDWSTPSSWPAPLSTLPVTISEKTYISNISLESKILTFQTNSAVPLYVKVDTFSIDNQSDIKVLGGGKLYLIVTGTLTIKKNLNEYGTGDSSNFILLYLGTNNFDSNNKFTGGAIVKGILCFPKVTEIDFNSVEIDGAIYAPLANYKIAGNAKVSKWFYGKTFTITGSANIYH